jgi:hypothetical protein
MVNTKSPSLACLLMGLAVFGCATPAARGVPSGNEPTYVNSVEVIEHDSSAPADFASAFREVVLKGAVFYGTSGRPISLRIDLDKVHFKNALRALTIGDDNQTTGRIAVLDPSTGQQLASFMVQADAEMSGDLAAFIAISVIGALDPTGIVDIASTVGSATSANLNRSGTAAAMQSNLAAETLRQTFGDTRTRAVLLAKQNEGRGPTKAPTR